MAVFGTPLAPGGSRVLWLTRYDQLFAYPASQLTFASWWHSGLTEILKVRLWALGLNLESALAVQGSIFLLPLILIGLWQLRKENRTLLVVLAWGVTLTAMILVFPFARARGAAAVLVGGRAFGIGACHRLGGAAARLAGETTAHRLLGWPGRDRGLADCVDRPGAGDRYV
jgi:hypothetical protein